MDVSKQLFEPIGVIMYPNGCPIVQYAYVRRARPVKAGEQRVCGLRHGIVGSRDQVFELSLFHFIHFFPSLY